MSQHAAIIREAWEAFAARGLDAMADFWHEQIIRRAIEGAPDDVGEIRGREAMRRYYQDWLDVR